MKKKVTLRRYLAKQPQGLAPSEAVKALMEAAIALRNLHSDGRVHLQIQPDTVLVGGAALCAPTGKEEDRLLTGFAAPEIYKGVDIGPGADIYSFGALLMYAVTGEIPANSLQRFALEEAFSRVEQRYADFAGLLRRAMAEEVSQRFASMQELICAMAYFYTGKAVVEIPQEELPESAVEISQEVVPEPTVPVQPVQTRPVRRGVPVVLVAVFCAVVAVLLWRGYAPAQTAEPENGGLEQAYASAAALLEAGEYEAALESFTALEDYMDSAAQVEICRAALETAALEADYRAAEELETKGQYAQAGIAFARLGDYADARERSFAVWDKTRVRQTLAGNTVEGWIGILKDGTAVIAGVTSAQKKAVKQWKNLVEVDGDGNETFWGLGEDGSFMIAYNAGSWYASMFQEAETWTDLVRVYSKYGYYNVGYMVGLKKDGTVVYASYDYEYSYYLQEIISEWTDIVDIVCTYNNVIGLRSDGTVVATGEIPTSHLENVIKVVPLNPEWRYGRDSYAAICADGTVYADVGYEIGRDEIGEVHGKVQGLANVVDICGPLALHADGTVTVYLEDAAYWDYERQRYIRWDGLIEDWQGITALCNLGNNTIAGLKSDGTVCLAGNNCSYYNNAKDVAALFGRVAVKHDGTVVIDPNELTDAKKWTGIRVP